MRSIALSLVLAGGLCLGLNACNSGGTNLNGGSQCPIGYNPIPNQKTTVPGQLNVSMKSVPDPALPALPAGCYTYAHSDLTYQDLSSPTPLIVHVVDHKTVGTATSVENVACVRNDKLGMNFPTQSMTGVTDIQVNADGTQVVSTRQFNWSIQDSRILVPVPTITAFTPANPAPIDADSAYPKSAFLDFYMVAVTPNVDYEIRAFQVVPGQSATALSVHMNYAPLTAGPCPPVN